MLGHDDVRPQHQRAGLHRRHRARARSRNQLHRYGECLLRRRERAVRRQGARPGPPRARRARDEGVFSAGSERPERTRLEPPPSHRGVRRVARAAADRLDRSLSAAPPAGRHSDRRDAARARRSDPSRQGALHRNEHVPGVEERGGAVGREGIRPESLRLRADGVQPARPNGRARGDSRRADVSGLR